MSDVRQQLGRGIITLQEFFRGGFLPQHLKGQIYEDLAVGKLPGYKCGKQWVVDPDELVIAWKELYFNGRR